MDYFILFEVSTGSDYLIKNRVEYLHSGIIVKYITDSFIFSLFAQYNSL
jgi:hypothetical protein